MTEQDPNGPPGEPAALSDMPQRMLEDLILAGRADEKSIRQIAEQLGKSTGMLSPERIAEIVNQHLAGEEAAAAARIVANVEPADIPQALSVLKDWSPLHAGELQTPSDRTIKKIQSNLGLLVQDHPALRLMHKAQRLLREIGNELQSIIFICDLRPVYDGHTEIVGFVPLVNMQIGYTKQNRELESFEVALSRDELRHIVDCGQDALTELQILESMFQGPSETDENQ
jgi:hypothetical protein